ncbi:hypothetical protein DS985_28005 [Escherichia coli]|nr:hypothetical protein [Escherichia coli]EFH9154601.1 hypothetical protein [Escherichia coli]MDN2160380.1 hypothetical protein [Escherichia coli]RBY54720.1 hypothetical protein DS985_28005 [Escherichia coli]
MLPSETMIWQPEFTDKTLSRKPGAVHKAQNFSVFFVKKIIRMKFHNIAGKFASLWCGFAFTGFS